MSTLPILPVATWPTPAEARPDLNFVVRDLKRALMRVADNLRWYEQSWLGVPIWQLADDLVALQRIVVDTNPRWIIETGTEFAGSAIFFRVAAGDDGQRARGSITRTD